MQVEYRLDASPPVVVPTSCGLMGKGEGDALRRALGKLSAASLRYDAARDRELMRGFSAMRMSATASKQQMLVNFGVRLDAAELGALVQQWRAAPKLTAAAPLTDDGEPMLDCGAFRAAFQQLGKMRAHRARVQRERAAATWEEAEAAREERVRAIFASTDIGLSPASLSHAGAAAARQLGQQLSAAMSKLAEQAALHADPSHRASGSLEAFDASTMTPMLFREQLKRNLNVWLTRQELAALVRELDRGGVVDCGRFLVLWRSLGRRERDKRRDQWRSAREGKARRQAHGEMRAQRQAQERNRAQVSWPGGGGGGGDLFNLPDEVHERDAYW